MLSEIRSFIQSAIGVYTPFCDPESGVPYAGFAGVDWEYIVSAVLLVLTVYCVFKVLGAVISKIGG